MVLLITEWRENRVQVEKFCNCQQFIHEKIHTKNEKLQIKGEKNIVTNASALYLKHNRHYKSENAKNTSSANLRQSDSPSVGSHFGTKWALACLNKENYFFFQGTKPSCENKSRTKHVNVLLDLFQECAFLSFSKPKEWAW
jgi:hypothetical protein